MSDTLWPVLIKADDMTYGSSQDAWTRLVALVQEEDAHVDIGFILKRGALEAGREGVRDWDRRHGRRGYSFFNHGSAHARDEFSVPGTDFDALFRELRAMEVDTFGAPLSGFGAPYNVHCNAAVASYQRMDPQAFVYYPDIGESHYGGDWRHAVSFDYHVSFERKEQGNDPVFEYFRRTHAKRMDERRPMVLQIHPARWSSSGFDEFRRILRLLRSKGAVSVTPQRFMELTAERPERQAPAARQTTARAATPAELSMRAEVAELGGWFVSRYEPAELDRTRAVIERTLGGSEIIGDSVLDFGCGAGDWLYLLAGRFGFRKLYGIEPKADTARCAQAALSHLPQTEARVWVARVGDAVEGLTPVSLTVCNRALTYIRLPDYLRAIAAAGQERSHHFIGYQNFFFYWKSLGASLKKGDAETARRRISVLTASLEYMCGLSEGRAHEHFMSTRDLRAALLAEGYEMVREVPVDSDPAGRPLIDGLLFRPARPAGSAPKIELTSLGLANDLRARGRKVDVQPPPPALVEAVRALRQRDYPAALACLPAQACTPAQPTLVMSHAAALFGAGRLGECTAWLNRHRQLVF